MDGAALITLEQLIDPPEIEALRAGPCAGVTWAAGMPTDDDVVALSLARAGALCWAIVIDGVAVGLLGTHRAVHDDDPVEIGYSIAPGSRRRGYARRGVALMMDELKNRGIRSVRATVIDTGNDPSAVASREVLVANGFHHVSDEVEGPAGHTSHFTWRA